MLPCIGYPIVPGSQATSLYIRALIAYAQAGGGGGVSASDHNVQLKLGWHTSRGRSTSLRFATISGNWPPFLDTPTVTFNTSHMSRVRFNLDRPARWSHPPFCNTTVASILLLPGMTTDTS